MCSLYVICSEQRFKTIFIVLTFPDAAVNNTANCGRVRPLSALPTLCVAFIWLQERNEDVKLGVGRMRSGLFYRDVTNYPRGSR